MTVDCAHFHYVEPPAGWTTDDQSADNVDIGAATEDPQQRGHMATGGADPSTYTQSQGQVPGDGEPQSPIAESTDNRDNTGDVA